MSCVAATTPAQKEAALLAAAKTLVTAEGLTPAAIPTVVAVNTQNATPVAAATRVPTAGFSLDTLSHTDASNYYMRALGSSVAQDTPDASAKVKFAACTFVLTHAATGAFTLGDDSSSASGVLDFGTGNASGSFHDPSETPADGTFVGSRR